MSPTGSKLESVATLAAAFISGFALMGFEIFGVRVLAPFFGSGAPVWGAVITVVMTGLAVGYAFGGWLADRRPALSTAALLILPSALLMIVFPVHSGIVCRMADSLITDRRAAALLASSLLFPPIVFFLGAVSPVLVKLRIDSLSNVGAGSGAVYAAGTAGGVAGTLAASFFLIGVLPSSTAVFLLGASLLASSSAAPLLKFRGGRGGNPKTGLNASA